MAVSLLHIIIFSLLLSPRRHVAAIRAVPLEINGPRFLEAPQFRNGAGCEPPPDRRRAANDPRLVHVAMTLDLAYIRGTMAAVHSVLKHGSCPESIFFHFIASAAAAPELRRVLAATFPSLPFKVYPFDQESDVASLISPSVRGALDRPLNYARNYLASLLDVNRVIYLDSDVILVDDIKKLWDDAMTGGAVVAAPEYCNANFTSYFTEGFWKDRELRRTFEGRRPCYFNTGVMVLDLDTWRNGEYDGKIRRWMEVQRKAAPRIYELGSLPPFLLVFGGHVYGLDHRWNQHGLGGDNESGNCREMHPGPVSLMHWSGKGKPWDRLDAGRPCPVDLVWKAYDLWMS